jgi:outer membrane protein OmpA-like peptidoglycan-associated protein
MKFSAFTLLFLILGFNSWTQGFVVEQLPDHINTAYDEITPVLSRDGKQLYFTRVGCPIFETTLLIDSVDISKRANSFAYYETLAKIFSQISGKPILDPISSVFNQDIWITDINEFSSLPVLYHPGFPLNHALPNSLVSLTPDPNAFYIINQHSRNGNLDKGFSIIKRTNDTTWQFPEPIKIDDFYTITSDVSLTLSFDGQTIILSATRLDSKDMDLYVCFKKGNNHWTSPLHMGTAINTTRRETTPFISEDNQTLFFSSNRWSSSGGNDIFMSRRQDSTWTNWSNPIRLTEPINSVFDDSQPYFNMTSGYLYFTSKRGGNSNIYRVQIAPPQPTEILVNGRILHSDEKLLMQEVELFYGVKGSPPNRIVTSDGNFQIRVPKGLTFEFRANKIGYIGIVDSVFFRRDYYYFRDHEMDLYLEPLRINTLFRLDNIYFKQSTAIVLEESTHALQQLFILLQENPTLHIRIEGHTDDQGSTNELQILSEARTKTIKEFLVSKGINAERVETEGFGATNTVSQGKTEAERSKNRRVEIRIIKL